MCSCVIIANDKEVSEQLKTFIENNHLLSLTSVFDNSSDAFVFLEKHNIDLIFIDTQISDFYDFNLLNKIQTNCKIVLIAADISFAIKAFDFLTIDFLVKPITEQRLLKTITKIRHFNTCDIPMKMFMNQPQFHKNLMIHSGQRKWQIPSHTILFAESQGEYVKVWYNINQSLLTLKTLLRVWASISVSFVQTKL